MSGFKVQSLGFGVSGFGNSRFQGFGLFGVWHLEDVAGGIESASAVHPEPSNLSSSLAEPRDFWLSSRVSRLRARV